MKPTIRNTLLICAALTAARLGQTYAFAETTNEIKINLRYKEKDHGQGDDDHGDWKFKAGNREARNLFAVTNGDTIKWINPTGGFHRQFKVIFNKGEFDMPPNSQLVPGTTNVYEILAANGGNGWHAELKVTAIGDVGYAIVAVVPPHDRLRTMKIPFPLWDTVYVPASLSVSQGFEIERKPPGSPVRK